MSEYRPNARYSKSQQLLARALKSIPLGSQTFSKSYLIYPEGQSPLFIEKGKGSHVWDVDGNEYIDFVNGLASITLGYNDPDVTAAVLEQIEHGTTFTLPHRLEMEVAEQLVEMVPCAERVRFGKNGSDATSGAIRLARAYTGRDHIVVCGYHGWHDWYIGSTTRNRGVPEATRALTHTFSYNNIESLETVFKEYPDQIAAVILEPMNTTEPLPGFLESVKSLTHKNGSLLVFDETITGFRFANGGAQEYFNVIPDLATFGKGLANGYPVAALVGRAEVMKLLEEVFYSFTFGGEALSLAAALATMRKLQREPVVATLRERGQQIIAGVKQLIEKYDAGDFLSVSGNPVWSFLHIKECEPYSMWQIKTLFLQEILARGILGLGTHNLCYAHSEADIARLLAVYDEVFGLLKDAVVGKKLPNYLKCKPIEPIFKVR